MHPLIENTVALGRLVGIRVEAIKRFFAARTRASRDAAKLMKAAAVLEKHGLQPLQWWDDAEFDPASPEDLELFLAIKQLRKRGCIIVNGQGALIGRVYQLVRSREEIVQDKRSSFRLVGAVENKPS